MGNSLLRQTKKQLRSQAFEWVTAQVTPYCMRVIDSKTKILAERYNIDFGVIEEDWQTYVLRRNHPNYLVTIYDIIQQKQSNVCSSGRQASLIIEYIPYRLCDLGPISFQEGLYILKCILQGYRLLRLHKIDFYLLDETNICFNRQGKCKFWINQNLYLSKPSSNRITSQLQFIENVLEIVETRIIDMLEKYEEKKKNIKSMNLQNVLFLVRHFSTQDLDNIPSLISITELTNYQKDLLKSQRKENSVQKIAANKKISISKYKDTYTRNKNEVQFDLKRFKKQKNDQKTCKQPNNSKKLSLSFKLRNDYRKHIITEKSNRMQESYQSPRKQNLLSATNYNPESSQRLSIRQWKTGYYSPSYHSFVYK